MGGSYDLGPWLRQIAADPANSSLLPNGTTIRTNTSTWNDQWTYTAEGIPSVSLAATAPGYSQQLYHTQFDDASLQDYQLLGSYNKFMRRMVDQLDRGLLPYSFKGTADALAATVSESRLVDDEVAPELAARFADDVAAFQAAGNDWDAHKATIPARHVPSVNAKLMAITKGVDKGLNALDAWDTTIFPHQQVMADLEALNQALDALKVSDKATALAALQKVDLTWYGVNFSYETYLWDRSRHLPDFPILMWGAQGKLPAFLDVMPQYRQIEAGDFTTPVGPLADMRDAQLEDLSSRITAMCEVLEKATSHIEALM
jgi:hypothetical protein